MAMTLKAAKDELAGINKQLIDLQARKADLEAFVRVQQSAPLGSATRARKRGAGELRTAVAEAVEAILKAGSPRSTKDILSNLEAMGVNIPGEKKEQRLSQILSRERKTGRFEADRKHGWKLATKVHTLITGKAA
jgi:hypothetical protein